VSRGDFPALPRTHTTPADHHVSSDAPAGHHAEHTKGCGAAQLHPIRRARRDGGVACRLALVALGVGIFDNLDFERLAEVARELGRYEFLFTAAPLRIEMGMGSPLNPIAMF